MAHSNTSAQLALAAQHDAAQRHRDAIDALAQGAGAGDLQCKTQLGKRLLTGDRAPAMATEGARLLLESATQGEPEAAARMAALTALGVGRPQSWPDGLRWLVIAADRGWEPGRSQLRVLAQEQLDPIAHPDVHYWAQLASSIDANRWRRPAVTHNLSDDPRVTVVEDFIDVPVCEWLIARSRSRLTRAQVYDPVRREVVVRQTRSNSVANYSLNDVEFLEVLMQAKMSVACGVPMNHMEAPAVLHYAVGEEASNHFDFVDPATPDYAGEIARNGQRRVTFLIYLNDDYEGGETRFANLGFGHKGRRGQGLFFINAHADMQPDLRMLHAGCAPTRGEKWIVSQFIRSRPILNVQSAR